VTGGNLVMTANASSPYGFFQLKANKSIGKGTLLEAYAIHPDAGKNCDADGDAETAAEIGYKVDFGWNNVIRMMDYPDLTKYTIQASASGSNSGYISTSINVDTGWHVYRIYRPESGTSEFQIDSNPFESIAVTHTPATGLSPWLMSYVEPCASQNAFKVDWIRVRKWCGTDPSILVGIEESYQIEITIDIKPGSDTNPINLESKGTIPVAIFSTADFDAQTVDPSAVKLAGASVKMKKNGEYMASFEDVDEDGMIDIVLHFITTELELSFGDTTAMLEGQTFDGILFWGEDTITVIAE
jgi:hypothetical protein